MRVLHSLHAGTTLPRIETHPAFPNRINVQFARVLGRDRVEIRIWERGARIVVK